MKKHLNENGDYRQEFPNGTKGWYRLHRGDGPAIENDNGDKWWLVSGKRHREDGPAVEWADGDKIWWWEGEYIMDTEGPVTEAQVKEFKLRRIS